MKNPTIRTTDNPARMCSYEREKLRNKADVYRMCMADKPEALLSDIVLRMNIPTEQVVRELRLLIEKDFIEDIYVDFKEGRIKMLSVTREALKINNDYINVKCENCGAVNSL